MTIRTGWLAIGWLGVAAVIWLSLMPGPPELDIEQGDKLQHVAAYASLMLWFAQVVLVRERRVALALALLGLGVALEFAQLATAYRTFSLADIGADAIGVAIGWLLAPPRAPNLARLLEQFAERR